MSGAQENYDEEFDSALAAFFPAPPSITVQHVEPNILSQDSDSDTEVLIQYPDPLSADINVQEVTTDFVENVLPNEESNDEDVNTLESVSEDQDPEIQIIHDKFRNGCKCKQGNCLSSFDPNDIYQFWLTLSELDGNEYD